MTQHPIHTASRRMLAAVTLALSVLSGCTPPQELGDAMAEPVLAAPPETAERKAMPSPCEQDDDGIGGTGCPVE